MELADDLGISSLPFLALNSICDFDQSIVCRAFDGNMSNNVQRKYLKFFLLALAILIVYALVVASAPFIMLFRLGDAVSKLNAPKQAFAATYENVTGKTRTKVRVSSDGIALVRVDETLPEEHSIICDYRRRTESWLDGLNKTYVEVPLRGNPYTDEGLFGVFSLPWGSKQIGAHRCHGLHSIFFQNPKYLIWYGDDTVCLVEGNFGPSNNHPRHVERLVEYSAKCPDHMFQIPSDYRKLTQSEWRQQHQLDQ